MAQDKTSIVDPDDHVTFLSNMPPVKTSQSFTPPKSVQKLDTLQPKARRNANRSIERAAKRAALYLHGVIQGTIDSDRDKIRAADITLRAYSTLYGKPQTGQVKTGAPIKIKHTIVKHPEGGLAPVDGGGRGVNAIPCVTSGSHGGVSQHNTSSRTVYEKMGGVS